MGNPQAWDRYAYAMNNPLRYVDPSGHAPKEDKDVGDWNFFYWTQQERYKKETLQQKYDRLFSYIFWGSGPSGEWLASDWEYYMANRDDLWNGKIDWIHPDPVEGWAAFAYHVERLASHYKSYQKDQFINDFALVFGGIDTTKPFAAAAWEAKNGPIFPFLHESNEGLAETYLEGNKLANQSHHYAGIFILSYRTDPMFAKAVNYGRDTDNAADINLGSIASSHADIFRYHCSDPWALAGLIMSLIQN